MVVGIVRLALRRWTSDAPARLLNLIPVQEPSAHALIVRSLALGRSGVASVSAGALAGARPGITGDPGLTRDPYVRARSVDMAPSSASPAIWSPTSGRVGFQTGVGRPITRFALRQRSVLRCQQLGKASDRRADRWRVGRICFLKISGPSGQGRRQRRPLRADASGTDATPDSDAGFSSQHRSY